MTSLGMAVQAGMAMTWQQPPQQQLPPQLVAPQPDLQVDHPVATAVRFSSCNLISRMPASVLLLPCLSMSNYMAHLFHCAANLIKSGIQIPSAP